MGKRKKGKEGKEGYFSMKIERRRGRERTLSARFQRSNLSENSNLTLCAPELFPAPSPEKGEGEGGKAREGERGSNLWLCSFVNYLLFFVFFFFLATNFFAPPSASFPLCSVIPFFLPFLPNSYVFTSPISKSDVNCNDKFWSSGCAKDYCSKFDAAGTKSAHVMSIPYFMSAGLSPFLGMVVDKVGNRAVIASIAPVMLLAVHGALGFSSGSPVLPLIGQGMAYSLFAAVLWPSVPLTVEEKSVGTAYGLITAVQNAGLAGFPIVISTIYAASGNEYIPHVETFFMACAAGGLVVGFFLNFMDGRRGGFLNARNVEERREEIAREEREERAAKDPPTPLIST